MPSDKIILSYTWNDIQAMQQKTYTPPKVTGPADTDLAKHAPADDKLLSDLGFTELKKRGYFGVIDRLSRRGLI